MSGPTSRVVWNSDEFIEQVFLPSVRAGMGAAASVLVRQMKINLNGPSPSAPGSPPGKDTGHAARSIGFHHESNSTVRVGTNVEYLRFLEHGFTARGTMTIPLTPAAKLMRRRHKSLRERNDLVFIKTAKHKFLARKASKGARAEFLFLLKDNVTVQPRPWARRSLQMAEPSLEAAFVKGMSEAMAGKARDRLRSFQQ